MLQTIDASILLFIQNHLRFEWASGMIMRYTALGDGGLLWIGICLLFLCFKRTRRAGLLALLAMLLGLFFNNILLKNLVSRPRPWLSVPGLLPLMEPPDPLSFPSGHTCAAFASAGVWLRTLPRRWMKAASVSAAALMGFSRMYIGVHYPTDVLAGMCVGLLCAWAVLLFYRKKFGTISKNT